MPNGVCAIVMTLPVLLLAWGCLSPDCPLPENVIPIPGAVPCGELTYENFGASFFTAYCLRCHSEANVGDFARRDAPTGINYDTLDGIRDFRERIRMRAGIQGDMPPLLLPTPRPSQNGRIHLLQWIDCGLPSQADDLEG